MSGSPADEVRAWAPAGVAEIVEGDDLVDLLAPLVTLRDGDIVVVTSKAVAKAEGRVVPGTREEHLDAESVRLIARRGPTSIVRTRHGLTLAAAGIDASNVATGSVVLLPIDPDDSARRLRAALIARTGARVGVVVTDTAGRAWREGQTDIAIGAAGVVVSESFAGRLDTHGNELAVTAPAVADEIAGLAELVCGKLGARPFTVVRGRGDLVLAAADDGPGAAALVRPEGGDLFGYGAREAVIRAARRARDDQAPFGSAVQATELVDVLRRAGLSARPDPVDAGSVLVTVAAARREAIEMLGFAHGWQVEAPCAGGEVRLRPIGPGARGNGSTPT